jgi:uncharacterized protein YycO
MLTVALFKGKGFISKAIRLQTRSPYSHAGIIVGNTLYEAWHVGGVQKGRIATDPFVEFECPSLLDGDDVRIVTFLESVLGMPYDWIMVARFLTRRAARENERYFCSELVMDAFRHVGIDLLHAESHNVSPRDLALSPLLVRK